MVFGPEVEPVKLPTPFESPEDDSDAVLAGWGLNKVTKQFCLVEQVLSRLRDMSHLTLI